MPVRVIAEDDAAERARQKADAERGPRRQLDRGTAIIPIDPTVCPLLLQALFY